MKFIFFLIALNFTFSVYANSNCPNLSGVYASKQDDEFRREYIWKQTGCEEMSLQGHFFYGDGTSYYNNPLVVKTDGIPRKPYPNIESTWTFTPISLILYETNVTNNNSGKCNERHEWTIDHNRNLIDNWQFECPNKVYKFKTISFRR